MEKIIETADPSVVASLQARPESSLAKLESESKEPEPTTGAAGTSKVSPTPQVVPEKKKKKIDSGSDSGSSSSSSDSEDHAEHIVDEKIERIQSISKRNLTISYYLNAIGVLNLLAVVLLVMMAMDLQTSGPFWYTIIFLGLPFLAQLLDVVKLIIMMISFQMSI